jgi:hypothetical protein
MAQPPGAKARVFIGYGRHGFTGCGKRQLGEEKRPPGLKPLLISLVLRGPEGPLFHGDAHILDFFEAVPFPKPVL